MSPPVAIITGAGRGIGRATALELAKAGYQVALVARSTAELRQTAELCAAAHAGETSVESADVCDAAAIASIVERTDGRWGRVDAFIHCAGMAPLIAIDQMTDEQWRGTVDTNLSAAFHFCRALWPVWRRQGGGVGVLVSSLAARDPFNGFAAYAAAKAGVNMLGMALAREGAAIGVRMHVVAPGAVETRMFRDLFTPQQFPAEKALAPADVAGVIVQCVRGDLRYSSGEVIYVHKTM
ncbi:MAG: SDR family oxidoreductase [Tepidisphaeraceae bacterium]|jgi:3-oxoacyl-[acyl-carrier protein] reductase